MDEVFQEIPVLWGKRVNVFAGEI